MLSDSEIDLRVAQLEAWYGEQAPMSVPELPAWLREDVRVEQLVAPGCGRPSCSCEVEPDLPCSTMPPELPLPRDPEAIPAAPTSAAEPVRWAVPGVWDDEPAPAARPAVGAAVARVQAAVADLVGVELTDLPGPSALVEAEALQQVVQQLRVLLLPRLEDVASRKLFALTGFHGVAGWQRAVAPDAVAADRALASRLPALPALSAAVAEGRVSLAAATKVAKTMKRVGSYLDGPDGLIDGQPGDEVVDSVVDNTLDLVCRARGGVAEDDPFLQRLTDEVTLVHLAGGSQHTRVERALTLLGAHVGDLPSLSAALEEQTFAIIPNLLEQQQAAAEERRGAALRRNEDGSWELEGRLTSECGELLFTALAAEARRDPANPVDTQARQHARTQAMTEAGVDPAEHPGKELGEDGALKDLPTWERAALRELDWGTGLPGEHDAQKQDLQSAGLSPAEADEGARLVPRSRTRRLHDALQRLLERYLASGLGGIHDQVPVQFSVTIPSRQLEGLPGALPGRTTTGRPVARSLLKLWWDDANVTCLLMAQGWVPLGVVHGGRTITAAERLALNTQWGNRCAGVDCCPGTPDPLIRLHAHHVKKFSETGTTVLRETLPVCESLHQDLHLGKKAIRLRDGRIVTEDGYLTDR